MDGQFGSDGNFYLLTYGDGFFTQGTRDAGIYRSCAAKKRNGRRTRCSTPTVRTDPTPLTVQFSSAGSSGSRSG